MIATGIAVMVVVGVIIGVFWSKNRELSTNLKMMEKKYDKLYQKHTELLLSRAQGLQGPSMQSH